MNWVIVFKLITRDFYFAHIGRIFGLTDKIPEAMKFKTEADAKRIMDAFRLTNKRNDRIQEIEMFVREIE